jgi:hypothetical protein
LSAHILSCAERIARDIATPGINFLLWGILSFATPGIAAGDRPTAARAVADFSHPYGESLDHAGIIRYAVLLAGLAANSTRRVNL